MTTTQMTPIQPGTRLVEVTAGLIPTLNEIEKAVSKLLNDRLNAIDAKFGVDENMSEASYKALPEATRMGHATERTLELFASLVVTKTTGMSGEQLMDPRTLQLFDVLVKGSLRTRVAPNGGHPVIVHYVSADPASDACSDPTCAGCVARRAKLERERA